MKINTTYALANGYNVLFNLTPIPNRPIGFHTLEISITKKSWAFPHMSQNNHLVNKILYSKTVELRLNRLKLNTQNAFFLDTSTEDYRECNSEFYIQLEDRRKTFILSTTWLPCEIFSFAFNPETGCGSISYMPPTGSDSFEHVATIEEEFSV